MQVKFVINFLCHFIRFELIEKMRDFWSDPQWLVVVGSATFAFIAVLVCFDQCFLMKFWMIFSVFHEILDECN